MREKNLSSRRIRLTAAGIILSASPLFQFQAVISAQTEVLPPKNGLNTEHQKIVTIQNGIELQTAFKQRENSLIINYRVTNNSPKTVFLLDRGDTFSVARQKAVYLEPQPNGTVEVSRGGMPNAVVPDRSPSFPFDYGVTKLASKQTVTDEFSVELPFKPYSPFRIYTDHPTAMPAAVRQIRFCLPIIYDAATKTKTSEFLVLANYTDVARQESVCSEVFQLD